MLIARERRGRHAEAAARTYERHRATQRADDFAPQRFTLGIAARVQQRDTAADVIEYQQRARRQVMQQRHPGQYRQALRQALEEAHGVVRSESHQPARQRHLSQRRRRQRQPTQRGTQPVEQLRLRTRHRAPLVAEHERLLIEPYLQHVAETNEGITPDALPALDALEQETRLERREFGERRHRSVEIAGNVERRLHNNKKPIPEGSGDGSGVCLYL